MRIRSRYCAEAANARGARGDEWRGRTATVTSERGALALLVERLETSETRPGAMVELAERAAKVMLRERM